MVAAELSEEVRRARAGDEDAFARLHGRFRRLVHAVLLAMLEPEDAEELAQEVFVSAWLRLPELQDPGSFGAWICAIARNRARDRLRRRRFRLLWPSEPASVGPVPGAEAREALRAIRALPEAYRETLILRLVHDLSGPEIAALTGLTEGSVRVNLHRGMAALRERLGGSGE